MIRAMGWKGYRAFREPTTLELRPLTLLYGENGAGKSSSVRWLPLLAESIQQKDRPIYLDGIAGKSDLPGLIWQRSRHSFDFWLESTAGLRVEYQISDIQPPQFIERIQVTTPDSASSTARLEFIWDLDSDARSPRYTVQRSGRNGAEIVALSFEGPLPTIQGEASQEVRSAIQSIHDLLTRLSQQITWVPGSRNRPERDSRLPGSRPRDLRMDPDAALRRLAWEGIDPVPSPLLEMVKQGYAAMGWYFELYQPSRERVSARIGPLQSATRVDLIDGGEGLIQVLPVLVAVAQARLGIGPRIVCMENPELHLHTGAAARLATWLSEAITGDDPPTLLIETHSEVFQLAIQLAITRQQIAPDRVSLVHVSQHPTGESVLQPVELDRMGRMLRDEMVGFFQAPADLARDLYRERRARQ